MSSALYTIGHSTHSIERFVALLRANSITAIGDVRSVPYSRINPQFNQPLLKKTLKAHNIAYAFLGDELGARSEDPSHYEDGRVQYSRLKNSANFTKGVDRLMKGMSSYRIALMCAEKDPITCHRTILVCRHMRGLTSQIRHILETGLIETNNQAELRLLRLFQISKDDLFLNASSLIEKAYELQEQQIAYTLPTVAHG